MKSDKDIGSFEQRLADQVRSKWENYIVKRFDLSTARTDEELCLAGERLIVMRASSPFANATVKLNRNTNHSLRLADNIRIETLFGKFYLTNAAQADQWLDIIIGANFEYKKKVECGYIERTPEPLVVDFDLPFFTCDSTFHEMDLSGIVPAGAKAVSLVIRFGFNAVNQEVTVRKHGNTSWPASCGQRSQVTGQLIFVNTECPLDENRHIDYYVAAAPTPWYLNMTIKGWWL